MIDSTDILEVHVTPCVSVQVQQQQQAVQQVVQQVQAAHLSLAHQNAVNLHAAQPRSPQHPSAMGSGAASVPDLSSMVLKPPPALAVVTGAPAMAKALSAANGSLTSAASHHLSETAKVCLRAQCLLTTTQAYKLPGPFSIHCYLKDHATKYVGLNVQESITPGCHDW